ncbi:hypothetical protein [Rubritalea sp.]|uniref:hypothetical protein n=1 Tax=Rubritalea sp. TaxID=2109375 RepID=UPI003EF1681C
MKLLLVHITIILLGVMSSYASTPIPSSALTIDENGVITGLPDKYQPASFDFSSAKLSIADRSLTLPASLKPLFIDTASDLFSSASNKQKKLTYDYSFIAVPSRELFGITVEAQNSNESIFIIINLNNMSVTEATLSTPTLGTYPIKITR